MKKVLLGTTALFGAGLVASPAFAADGIKLSVGGFFKEAYMVVFDDDGEGEAGNEQNTDGFFNDAEIHFKGSTVLDNGLEVGARVELEGEDEDGAGAASDSDGGGRNGDQIDEAWIYFSGGFGEVRIGSEDEALAGSCIAPPGGTGNFSAFSPNQWGSNNGNISGITGFSTNTICTGVDGRGDAQKIVYISPVFAGFQLSASYTPNGNDERHGDGVGPHAGMPDNSDGESRHNVSLYANYTYSGDGWGLSAGLGASFQGHVEETVGPDAEEAEAYQGGLNLTFGNFAVGGVFEYYNDFGSISGVQETDAWVAGVGVSYSMDAFTVGAQYSHQDAELDPDGGDDIESQLDRVVLTGNYALGPGIAVDAELGYTWADNDPENDDDQDDYDAFEIGIGTNITF